MAIRLENNITNFLFHFTAEQSFKIEHCVLMCVCVWTEKKMILLYKEPGVWTFGEDGSLIVKPPTTLHKFSMLFL